MDFQGQFSALTSFSPDNDLDWFAGARYIPEVSYTVKLDSVQSIDFEASANLAGSILFHPFSASETNTDIDPYRIWARYSRKKFEVRAGLQKIDFGVATLLRPLQWFNQIDPRDPLQLTNGVYGVLARYYFLNNANIWVWGLYGNERTRGFDALETNDRKPEFGGRIQHPVPRGEIGLSYHHRTVNTATFPGLEMLDGITENKYGIDAKWDVTIGLWIEATYSKKSENIGLLTHQSLLNIGSDYTFAIGNGLNITAEHLISSFDESAFEFNNVANVSAFSTNYPLGFFDTLSAFYYYDWENNTNTVLINYEHQFKKITGYAMAYYNAETQQGIQQNNLVNNFSGPGIRVMLVYNH
ncbi:MAG: hypothetical protein CMC07_01745 [Flavobacteriaceae bacterium]|nr:hypothetical protein [Flavobacteriaceae bacterium]